MRTILAVTLIAPLLAGCAYSPKPAEIVTIDDSPADIRACRKLGRVSDPVPTGPGFDLGIDAMRNATLTLGGTDLLLTRRFRRDWSFVEGTAYRCPYGIGAVPEVIRVRY